MRYFINVQTHNRMEIRSKALFAIMEQFKQAGIKAPIPPINVKLIEKDVKPEEKKEKKDKHYEPLLSNSTSE